MQIQSKQVPHPLGNNNYINLQFNITRNENSPSRGYSAAKNNKNNINQNSILNINSINNNDSLIEHRNKSAVIEGDGMSGNGDSPLLLHRKLKNNKNKL